MITSTRARLGETPFAVVDVETTGFSPKLHDRVIEVAVVHADPGGTTTARWTTLVHPNRDLGPTHIHGLVGADMAGAPGFKDIAGDLAELLDNRVVVAHNARFDVGFLNSEYQRLGCDQLDWPTLCTLGLSRLVTRSGGGRLAHCLAAEGLANSSTHTALGDATATTALLKSYLMLASERGILSLADLGCLPVDLLATGWIRWSPTGRAKARGEQLCASYEIPLLTQLVRHLPAFDLSDVEASGDVAAYLDLLGRALEDRKITSEEARALYETAVEWGLSGSDLRAAHRAYLKLLAATALADDVLTELEDEDLHSVAAALGLTRLDVMTALAEAETVERTPVGGGSSSIHGLSVCFTGALQQLVDGEPMSRTHAQALARAAGLVVQTGVTKSLDLLVVADPDSLSGKARKAREYGTRIVSEQSFWQMLAR